MKIVYLSIAIILVLAGVVFLKPAETKTETMRVYEFTPLIGEYQECETFKGEQKPPEDGLACNESAYTAAIMVTKPTPAGMRWYAAIKKLTDNAP
jgi:hypothetical protein